VPVPFMTMTLPLTRDSVAGYVALEGQPLNLPDAYTLPPDAPFHINRSYDERTGYRTKSMLVVPMRTPHGETIGVVQLINCKPSFGIRLGSREETERIVQPFDAAFEKLAASLASQAAVTLSNSRLYDSIRRLFEGFVRASVTAIESRDPTTFGHSFRVADLTVGLAEAVDRCRTGIYGAARFSADEVMELRYAALLHDFGKVGVREHVLAKAKKLYPAELDRIRQRVEIIKRGLQLRSADAKLAHLYDKGRRGYTQRAKVLDGELACHLKELDAALDHVVAANEPIALPTEATEAIERLALRAFEDHLGEQQTVLTRDEAWMLATARGTLTEQEYEEIQRHVVHTYHFLAQIPWTREFRRIPEIARSHHEKLDGSGYPDGIKADEIPLQSKIMTIADIYDALTSWDRPYKASLPVERALEMLREEERGNAIDGALLDIFIDARVWTRTSGR
jgi:HD-GYP domain-containing protein (c-di-GMP phosphodiesterase class II)